MLRARGFTRLGGPRERSARGRRRGCSPRPASFFFEPISAPRVAPIPTGATACFSGSRHQRSAPASMPLPMSCSELVSFDESHAAYREGYLPRRAPSFLMRLPSPRLVSFRAPHREAAEARRAVAGVVLRAFEYSGSFDGAVPAAFWSSSCVLLAPLLGEDAPAGTPAWSSRSGPSSSCSSEPGRLHRRRAVPSGERLCDIFSRKSEVQAGFESLAQVPHGTASSTRPCCVPRGLSAGFPRRRATSRGAWLTSWFPRARTERSSVR